MRTLAHLFLSLAGFGAALGIAYYIDPYALDVVGFGVFYAAVALGAYNLFLLFALTFLQAGLLAALFIAFLVLLHINYFTFITGMVLIIFVIIIERYGARSQKN